MKALNNLIGPGFVRYLLYTPRPADLPASVAAPLRHRRDLNMDRPIFDYSAA